MGRSPEYQATPLKGGETHALLAQIGKGALEGNLTEAEYTKAALKALHINWSDWRLRIVREKLIEETEKTEH